jgi:hypothetical protein
MGFDVDKCIELHNRVVAHARSRLLPEHQPKLQRSWFTAHNVDPSSPSVEIVPDLDIELDDDLKTFLSGIDIVVPEDHQYLAFNPLLIGVPRPYGLIPDMWKNLDDEYENFMLLYSGTGHDPGGLVYSHTTQQVCYMDDLCLEPQDMRWADLQDVLEVHWSCVESGKFVVDAKYPGFGYDDGLRTQGWRVEGWTEEELQRALEVWSNLVNAITKRLPRKGEEEEGEEPQRKKRKKDDEEVLIPSEVLNKYPAIPAFARAFLSRAKKPPFTSIAPQLDVPDEAFLHRIGTQLQALHPDVSLNTPQHEFFYLTPFLLLPWRTQDIQLISQSDRDRWKNTSRSTRILDDRAGLYIIPDDFQAHSSSLLLSFQLGGNGHVLRGDGSTVERERAGQDVLYRHGICNPFIPGHGTPLAAVLVNWWEQVENEDWGVDENGVVGGEECWKKADTEDYAEDFAIDWEC